ncbi:MAG: DUF1566 domain-containing protein [Desulfobacterales bacterium]|nr:DUF1566 domain-containing protein [Desulfobacterales bacterium]
MSQNEGGGNDEIGWKRGWRLPNKEELISVLDTSQSPPALPEGHPFSKLNDMDFGGDGNYIYLTSTEEQGDSNSAWMINMSVGRVGDSIKLFDYKIWPVRNSN